MAAPTTIRSLAARPLDIPLHTPFGIAGGAQDLARNLLVTVELADGTRGYGEAAPFPAYNGETQAIASAAIEAAASLVEGADVREWRRVAVALRGAIGPIGSAQCAIETAVLDALTRQAHMPLWAFFGGVGTSLETDMTVTTGTAEQAAADARSIAARGIRTIKVKVGSGDLALDLARVQAIAEVAPKSPLILDGNAAFSADGALQLVSQLRERAINVALLEQPVKKGDWAGMQQVAQWAGVPVAADETATDAAAALRIVHERAAHVVNIKLMKCGIAEALDIAAICRAARLGLMIGGNVESILAMTTSACFAAGQGGFQFVDLDTPLFMAENPFTGGMVYESARIDLSGIIAGHGVTPRV
ncbi:MAG TPA: dipeptide epimerase [Kouleothrix sp.]|uniref:dipeptide epimerase n=1 Tax=Kouleothrix sp. TaxID=2779161 RepID=UPI002CC1F548|nr:dipeptide epimerase [Kouleothrix sp.]HRC74865.1 dipeptide epimerase [Kouleothrix sp.]